MPPAIAHSTTSATARSHEEKAKSNRFKCTQCSKTFTRNANLKAHVISAHSTEFEKTSFACSIDGCEKTFGRADDCYRHRRTKHESHSARYVCGGDKTHNGFGCGQRFDRRDALQQHRRSRKAKHNCLKQRYEERVTAAVPDGDGSCSSCFAKALECDRIFPCSRCLHANNQCTRGTLVSSDQTRP